MENLDTALLLMVVGMLTVYAILLIVIYMGKLLINLVNKYAPEEAAPAPKRSKTDNNATVPAPTLAAISAAISLATQGKGRVTNVERI